MEREGDAARACVIQRSVERLTSALRGRAQVRVRRGRKASSNGLDGDIGTEAAHRAVGDARRESRVGCLELENRHPKGGCHQALTSEDGRALRRDKQGREVDG